jgi:hypothetical protein
LDERGAGATTLVVTDGRDELFVGRLVGARVDLATVDVVARLHLCARRHGLAIRLRDPSPRLAALLELVGLADLLIEDPASALEADGEPELGEQVGGQEVVEPGDLPP